MARRTLALAVGLLAALTAQPGAGAQDDDPSIGVSIPWKKTSFLVVIVPPAYGPIYDAELQLFPNGTEGGPRSPYVLATVDAVHAWSEAARAYSGARTGAGSIAELRAEVLVVGDGATLDDVARADVVVHWIPTANFVGNAGTTATPARRVCDVTLSTWFLFSMTPDDTFNVMMHEYAHCLGLGHAGLRTDLMNGVYAHYVGVPGNPRDCASTLDLAGLSYIYGLGPEAQGGIMSWSVSIPASEYAFVPTPLTRGACGNDATFGNP